MKLKKVQINYCIDGLKDKRNFNFNKSICYGFVIDVLIYSFRKNNPLSGCSVNNCEFTGDDNKLSTADAVIIHVQRGIFPNTSERIQKQRWVFLNDESPFNAFSMSQQRPRISDLANIFNWSMTYR